MGSDQSERREVVIVGAGPVGLTLALALARRGRGVLVLERNGSTSAHSRAPAIWPATQEILAELGVIDAFLSEGIVLPRIELHDVDRNTTLFTAPIEELSGITSYPHLLVLPQSRTESLCSKRSKINPALKFGSPAKRSMSRRETTA